MFLCQWEVETMLEMPSVFYRTWWEGTFPAAWPIPLLKHQHSLAKSVTLVPLLPRALLAGDGAGIDTSF